MPAQMSGFYRQLKETLAKMSKKTKWTIVIAAVLIVALAIFLTIYLNKTEYVPLFSGISDLEASEIAAYLYQNGLSYNMRGNIVYVPADNELAVRAQLALAGYPKSGFGYELFLENIGIMSSNFEMQQVANFHLQNRLADTIVLLEGIKSAFVTINPGVAQTTIIDTRAEPASASVTLITDDDYELTRAQVRAIQRLVSTSITNMPSPDNVFVTDQHSTDYTYIDGGTALSDSASQLKLSIEQEISNRNQKKVMNLLASVYGLGKISVSVNCIYDIDRKLTQIKEYYTTEGRDEGYLNTAEGGTIASTDGGTLSGLPGTIGNTDIPIYQNITSDGNEIYFENDWAYDYLVNSIAEEVQSNAGEIIDLTISVVIDIPVLDNVVAGNLRELIATAVGIDKTNIADKITVVPLSFFQPEPLPEPPPAVVEEDPWTEILWYAVIGLLALIILLTIIFFLIIKSRGKKIKRARSEIEAAQAAAAAAAAAAITEAPVKQAQEENKRSSELKEQLRTFTESNPEISAQMIKTWLKGGDAVE